MGANPRDQILLVIIYSINTFQFDYNEGPHDNQNMYFPNLLLIRVNSELYSLLVKKDLQLNYLCARLYIIIYQRTHFLKMGSY